MSKELLINVSEGEECRIALVEDAKLEELYMERSSSTSHVNNIYKGRVTNVEPSIQAAFIDFGLGRNGFLHISDLMPTYFGRRGEDVTESVGRKISRRDRPPIQRCLRRGDEIVVQVIKEGIGTKGPTLSSYLSISGKILVMMPGMSGKGVSRKIEDEEERRRLRTILDALKPPPEVGFIIRTAGIGKTKAEIQRDFTYLTRLWSNIEKKRDSGPGPMELFTEGDLVTRTVRDVFTSDIERIIIDNKEVAKRVKEVIKISSPRTRNKVELYEDPIPLFHKYNIEQDIEMMHSRHVPLPSGGSLVIDSTEAVVAIDVNSGKFRDHSDAETTAFKTDMEAADEIPRQLRLRDLGGVIICDFIDLRFERHRRELEHKLHENFKKDRAKNKVLRMSQFGIIEMTRQRMRPSLKRSIYYDCPHCKGSGLVKTSESMSLDVMRRLAIAVNDQRVQRVELTVSPEVDFYLQNRKRVQIADLEQSAGKRIIIRAEAKMGLDEIKLDLFDTRDSLVQLPELSASSENGHLQQGARPRDGRQRQDQRRDQRGENRGDQRGPRPDGRRDQRGGRPPDAPHGGDSRQQGEEETIEDRFDLEGADAAIDERELEEERSAIAEAGPFIPSGNNRNQPPRGGRPQQAEQGGPRGQSGTQGNREGGNQQTGDRNENGEGQGGRRRRRRGGRGRRRRQGQWNEGQDQFAPSGDNQRRPDSTSGADAAEGADAEDYEPAEARGAESDRDDRGRDFERAAGERDSESHQGWDRESEESDRDRDRAGDSEADVAAESFSAGGGSSEEVEEVDEAEAETIETAPAESNAAEAGNETEAAPGRPSRRRRGGRGRRGKRRGHNEDSPAAAEPGVAEAPQEQPSAQGAEAVVEPSSARSSGSARSASPRGRRRVSRTPPSGNKASANKGASGNSQIASPVAGQSDNASDTAEASPPLVRAPRGTPADRHHLNDEPVIHEPPRRPRSYRDLDAIPDDFD